MAKDLNGDRDMRLGMRTACPQCGKLHTLGTRLGVPLQQARFCSTECEIDYQKDPPQIVRTLSDDERKELAEWLAQKGELERMSRAVELKLVYCNSCVTSMEWSPALDGSQCHVCGFTLSLYGPFEQLPTLVPEPMPFERSWT